MNDKGYSKYQFSIFDKTNGQDGQYVVRTDDLEEFTGLVAYVKGMVTPPKSQTAVVAPSTAVDLSIDGAKGQGGTCPAHGTPLVWKEIPAGVNKNTGAPYDAYFKWSCPTRNLDGSYCKLGSTKK